MKSYIHFYKKNDEFTKAYNGPDYKEPWLSLTEEGMKVNYNKPKLTAITFDSITWVTDIPATGGTATKDNCTFKVYAKYDNGISVDILSDVTVTGELIVAETTATTRQSAGTLTLTASYGKFTATGNVTAYQEAAAPDFSTEPLTFNILSDGTINWTASDSSLTKTIEYKLSDSNNWTSITSNTGESAPTITVKAGDKIQFRGDNAAYCGGNPGLYSTFGGSTAEFEIEGNIMSLINSTDFSTLTTLESNFTFAFLFSDCTGLTSAENLILPAMTLAMGCYYNMFYGCTSLTTAPALPAINLAMGCYVGMFDGCTSLITAPALPAKALMMACYQGMFQNCSSLAITPALPATKLAGGCYYGMFYGTNVLPDCSNIDFASSTVVASGGLKGLFSGTKVTDNDLERLLPKNDNGRYYLPATTLGMNCYSYMFQDCTSLTTAPELPVTTLKFGCYSSMFKGCSNLTTAPALPATALETMCYKSMFAGCTSLTTAPALPATTLNFMSYDGMFSNCTSLNYIKCLATDISATYCTSNWVLNVASTGTFVKAASMNDWTEGNNGIPTGWTVENNS